MTNNTNVCKLTKGTDLSIPLLLTSGWNKIEVDMEDLLASIGQKFVSAESVKILASCRLRRIYFSDRKYPDWELPHGLRILPILERQYRDLELKNRPKPIVSSPEDMGVLFETMDLDGNGYVDADEVEMCFKLTGAPPHVMESEVTRLMSRATDKKRIYKKEFCISSYSIAGMDALELAQQIKQAMARTDEWKHLRASRRSSLNLAQISSRPSTSSGHSGRMKSQDLEDSAMFAVHSET